MNMIEPEDLTAAAADALLNPSTGPATINGPRLRKIMGHAIWGPPRRYGNDGWLMVRKDHSAYLVVSVATHPGDQEEWILALISGRDQRPTYDDLMLLHQAVFGEGWAYQVFAPSAHHINLYPHVLHLWGRADGARVLPDFGRHGTI